MTQIDKKYGTGSSLFQREYLREFDAADHALVGTDKVFTLFTQSGSEFYGEFTAQSIRDLTPTASATTAVTANGAIAPTASIVTINTTGGAKAYTLANGAEGKRLFIKMITDGGDGVVTVANLQGGTTLTFGDVNDFIELLFAVGKWNIIVNSGVVVA